MKTNNNRVTLRCALALAVAAACTNAHAATYTVTKTADTNDGLCNTDCSLREAMIAANNNPGADTISIPAGTYRLTLAGADEDNATTGDLDIRDNITIIGAGRTQTIIDGNQQDRIFEVFSGITATIRDLAINNGITQWNGAGLMNAGTTNLANVNFDGNVARWYGGAIESRGTNSSNAYLTIDSGRFTNNCSDSGGAMDTVGGLTITNSVFDGNKPTTKAGITCRNGDGAAIHVQYGENATIDKSTFINNIGAVGAFTQYWGATTITNSTFTNNQGLGGNYSSGGAGAIEHENGSWGGPLIVKNSTIANNTGYQYGGGTLGKVTLQNTIVANNTAPNGPDCSWGPAYTDPDFPNQPPVGNSPPLSQGNNIFGTTSGCGVTLASTDFVGNAGLGVVTPDTTTGQTYIPLLSTSPAIDKANSAACSTYDQLGKPRPIDGDGNGSAICDIGAIERPAPAMANVCPSGCQYTSIQAAINAAAAKAIITVGPGTYLEAITIDNSKSLMSTSGPESTIINASGLNKSVVTIGFGFISGFTIKGGNAANGGGVYIVGGDVTNNIIENNSAGIGGAVYVQGVYISGRAKVSNNVIRNNHTSSMGGVYLAAGYSRLDVTGNHFERNTGTTGTGVYLGGYQTVNVNNNVFKNNAGSAVFSTWYNTSVISNNLFIGNYAGIGLGQYAKANIVNNTITGGTFGVLGASGCDRGCSLLRNSIVWGNTTNIQAPLTIERSITASSINPMFVGGDNYRLRAGSPAIDTGANTSSLGVTKDMDGISRPQDGDKLGAGSTGDGSDYDMGAYEYR